MAVAVKGSGPENVQIGARDGLPTAVGLVADEIHVDVGGEFGAGILVFCGSLAVSGCVGSVHPVAEPGKLSGIGD